MTDWIVNLAASPDAPVRVVLFPHAGGQAGFYQRALGPAADVDAEVLMVQPPGRGSRSHEPPITDLARLTRITARELAVSHDARPTALLGHSSGGIYAFEVGKALERAGLPPSLLAVSAIPPPDHPYWYGTLQALLADPEDAYRRLGAGAIPGELENDTAAMSAFTTLIRADARLYQGLGRRPVAPAPWPISAFAATGDLLAPPTAMTGWKAWTCASYTQREYDGDHFFVSTHLQDIIRALTNDLGHRAESYGDHAAADSPCASHHA
jgi:surfactin synthase thioesterase subunit